MVEQDETETGLRAILNFGHTLGHLIETHAGYGTYLHGEAVGAGMCFAAFVSWHCNELSEKDWNASAVICEKCWLRLFSTVLIRMFFVI